VRLYENLGDEGDLRDPRAWLFRVAANLCHSRYRKAQRAERVQRKAQATMSVPPGPDEEFVRRERMEQVKTAMRNLNERDRLLVMLYQEHLSYAEIAGITGIKVTSVGKFLSRAIGRLAKMVCREELA